MRHADNSLQNTNFELFKPYFLSAIDSIWEKKKRPISAVFSNHITKCSAANIDRDVVESILAELINQKIISNKKIRRSCDSFYRSEKSANNSNILQNSSKNQVNLDTGQISIKCPQLMLKLLNQRMLFPINKPEEEINISKYYIILSIYYKKPF